MRRKSRYDDRSSVSLYTITGLGIWIKMAMGLLIGKEGVFYE